MLVVLVAVVLLCRGSTAMRCDRQPDDTSSERQSANIPFGLRVASPASEDMPDALPRPASFYESGQDYIVTLSGEQESTVRHFTDFMLTVESVEGEEAGSFYPSGFTFTKFSERCPNAVVQTSSMPKLEASALWRAPPHSGGCVVFRASIVEMKDLWYMDDGPLSLELCEVQTEVDAGPTIVDPCCACEEAKYEMAFEGLWSRHTHPKDFPKDLFKAKFSDVIGASHMVDYRFWNYGEFASEGLKELAEEGSTRTLESELKKKGQNIRTIIKARGIGYPNVTGKTFAVFRVDRKNHLMSVVSKIAPSPDWIVGVSGLELCLPNCSWIERQKVELYPWDIGTDRGISYESDDSPSIPAEPITRITSNSPNDLLSPFYDPSGEEMKPLANLYVTRQRLYEKESCDNTADPEAQDECAVTEWSSWSSCSASCGEGMRTRGRFYVDLDSARAHRCRAKLVSKTTCIASPCRERQRTDTRCELSEWSDWSRCSATCGRGHQSRTRHYLHPQARSWCGRQPGAQRLFETDPCDGEEPCDGQAAFEGGKEAEGGAEGEDGGGEEKEAGGIGGEDEEDNGAGEENGEGHGDEDNGRYGEEDNGRYGEGDNGRYGEEDNRRYGEEDNGRYGDEDNGRNGEQDNGRNGEQENGRNKEEDNGRNGEEDNGRNGEEDNGRYGEEDNGRYGEEDNGRYREEDNRIYGEEHGYRAREYPEEEEKQGPEDSWNNHLGKNLHHEAVDINQQTDDDGEPKCPRMTEWTAWSPCSVTCGQGKRNRNRYPDITDENKGMFGSLTWQDEDQEDGEDKEDGEDQEDGEEEGGADCFTLREEEDCEGRVLSCMPPTDEEREICLMEKDRGPCYNTDIRWYFDKETLSCQQFEYGGCRGNRNKFNTREACEQMCGGITEDEEMTTQGGPFGGLVAGNQITYTRNLGLQLPNYPYVKTVRGQTSITSPLGRVLDCVVSDWSRWSPCSTSCGPGYKQRARTIKVAPVNGGKGCPRKLLKIKKCRVARCDNHLANRDMYRRHSDEVYYEDTRENSVETDTLSEEDSVNEVSQTSEERGEENQPQTFGKPPFIRLLHSGNIDCELSQWTEWSSCSMTCGSDAYKQRTRSVISQPSEGGRLCDKRIEVQPCRLRPCRPSQ